MSNPLAEFSTDELLAELVRRRNAKPPKKIAQCDTCIHFRPWGLESPTMEVPDDYNACSKGHKMSFRMPDSPDPHAHEWGFYRRCCADRAGA